MKEHRNLLHELFRGQCSQEEIQFLQKEFESESQHLNDLKRFWEESSDIKIDEDQKEDIYKKIQDRISFRDRNIRRKRRLSVGKYAAILTGFFMLAYFTYYEVLPVKEVSNEITIELEDGTVRTIESGTIQLAKYTTVKLRGGTTLSYQTDEVKVTQKPLYNTIRVPFGKQLEVILSDSTVVYVNAGSSIRFPIEFIQGRPRKVFLKGEAYFEVTHNSRDQFVVHTEHLTTSVYGTRFNISSYPEEGNTRVTLVKGSVGVKAYYENSKVLVLKPDQMATFSPGLKEVTVRDVQAEDFIAWVEGVLLFKNETFRKIVPVLERAYDVQIRMDDENFGNKRFTGKFRSKNVNIENVLQIFSRAAGVDFAKRDNEWIIFKNKND